MSIYWAAIFVFLFINSADATEKKNINSEYANSIKFMDRDSVKRVSVKTKHLTVKNRKKWSLKRLKLTKK